MCLLLHSSRVATTFMITAGIGLIFLTLLRRRMFPRSKGIQVIIITSCVCVCTTCLCLHLHPCVRVCSHAQHMCACVSAFCHRYYTLRYGLEAWIHP